MTDSEWDEKVDQLLHDAERAESGQFMASKMGDVESVKRLREKYESLMAEANKLDPRHQSTSWQEHAEWEQRKQ